ncbi:hypothetical protein NVV94_24385 [Pseudomonas sp. LS1212]|uniref:hypothetical protein n=1 Tax=Pseudomonas sp. LS1212 TaxID=2972478 RepID=UPI00215CFF69|nr:hypothetical protein [Pseudomonas sp. LS1212]UVJ43638.1 hypothetical protein NVV94_24385 [Pseudomonas sp. LS1212]
MTESNKAVQQVAPQKLTWSDTNTDAQRAHLLASQQAGPAGTITAQIEQNILMPAARVKALRVQEPPLKTQRITLTEDHGRPHHGLVYYFGAQANSNIAACNERNAIQLGV